MPRNVCVPGTRDHYVNMTPLWAITFVCKQMVDSMIRESEGHEEP